MARKAATRPIRARRKQAPREPDRGTPELQAKRAALVGSGDPTLSVHPLGVLLARRAIDVHLYSAGVRYAFLFGKVFGRTKIVAHYADALIGGRDHTLLSDMDAARYEQALRDCWDAIAPLGARAKQVLDDLVIYEHFASWVLADPSSGKARADRALALAALHALAGHARRTARRSGVRTVAKAGIASPIIEPASRTVSP